MRIDATHGGIQFMEYEGNIENYLNVMGHTITASHRVNVNRPLFYKRLRGIYSCVSIAKAFAMLDCPWYVITPKQLYQWVVKHG